MKDRMTMLGAVIQETSGATFTISYNEEGWNCYFLQKKKKISNTDFQVLVDEILAEITINRVAVELSKKVKKPWRY